MHRTMKSVHSDTPSHEFTVHRATPNHEFDAPSHTEPRIHCAPTTPNQEFTVHRATPSLCTELHRTTNSRCTEPRSLNYVSSHRTAFWLPSKHHRSLSKVGAGRRRANFSTWAGAVTLIRAFSLISRQAVNYARAGGGADSRHRGCEPSVCQ